MLVQKKNVLFQYLMFTFYFYIIYINELKIIYF